MKYRWRVGFTACALALALCGITSAVAAVRFDHSFPKPGDVLRASPSSVDIFTDSDLAVAGDNFIQVQAVSALRVDLNDNHLDAQNPRHLQVSLAKNLSAGRYVVSFVITSASDGRSDRGQYAFYVIGQPTPADRDSDSRLSLTSQRVQVRSKQSSNDDRNTLIVAVSVSASAIVLAFGTVLVLRRR